MAQLTAIRNLVLAFILTGAPMVSADIVDNGSFEFPAISPGGFELFSGGSTAITGWEVVGQNVLSLSTTYSELGPPFFTGMVQFNSQTGLNALDLTGGGNDSSASNGVQQSVATLAGATYVLEFYVGRAQSNNGDSRYQTPTTMDLMIDGGPRTGFTNSDVVTPGFVGWRQFSTTFTAANATTTLTFLNGTPSTTNYLGLDNVSLTAVPEPSAFLLVGVAGVLSLASRCRRS